MSFFHCILLHTSNSVLYAFFLFCFVFEKPPEKTPGGGRKSLRRQVLLRTHFGRAGSKRKPSFLNSDINGQVKCDGIGTASARRQGLAWRETLPSLSGNHRTVGGSPGQVVDKLPNSRPEQSGARWWEGASLFSLNLYSLKASTEPDTEDTHNEAQLTIQLFLPTASCLVAFTQLQPSQESFQSINLPILLCSFKAFYGFPVPFKLHFEIRAEIFLYCL